MCLSSISKALYNGLAVENSERTEEAPELLDRMERLAYQVSYQLTPVLDGLKKLVFSVCF